MWSYQVSYTRLILEFLIGLGFTLYIMVASLMSPCPPLMKNNPLIGEILIVTSWLIIEFVFMRIRCLVASKLERIPKKNTLLWLGVITMLGQVIGGTLAYIFVDILRIFKPRNHCIFENDCETF